MNTYFSALDYITLEIAPGADDLAAYERLFGRAATPRPGFEDRWLWSGNLWLRLRARETPRGITAMAFRTSDLARAGRRLEQFALLAPDADNARTLTLDPARTRGLAVSVLEDPGDRPSGPPPGIVSGLDHLVIRTSEPEKTAHFYGGYLGLDLRMDRTYDAWGSRLLFFRCEDQILELVHPLAGAPSASDAFFGVTWRTPDIAAAHASLSAAGVTVSELRKGRRPGTQVFTVKSGTAGVPTLLLGPG